MQNNYIFIDRKKKQTTKNVMRVVSILTSIHENSLHSQVTHAYHVV